MRTESASSDWMAVARAAGSAGGTLVDTSASYADAAHPGLWPYQERVLGWAQQPQLDLVSGAAKYSPAPGLAGEGPPGDPMELCRKALAAMGISPALANPLIARSFLSSLKAKNRQDLFRE